MTTTMNKEEHLEDLAAEEVDFLARYVTWALWALAIIVIIATVTGQIESYNGLYIWFATHHITGIWADFAPLAVDSFTVIGELSIFAAISRAWHWKSRILPWLSAGIGICSSVAANVGDKVQFHSIPTDLTGAIFPLAGAFGIVIGLGVLKRIAKDHVVNKAAKRAKAGILTHEQTQAQLIADKIELQRKLDEAKPVVVDVSPPESKPFNYLSDEELRSRVHVGETFELKGMDVLIPPRPTVDVPIAEPVTVSREEARRQATDLLPGRPIINPDGLDMRSTGQWQVVPEELR